MYILDVKKNDEKFKCFIDNLNYCLLDEKFIKAYKEDIDSYFLIEIKILEKEIEILEIYIVEVFCVSYDVFESKTEKKILVNSEEFKEMLLFKIKKEFFQDKINKGV